VQFFQHELLFLQDFAGGQFFSMARLCAQQEQGDVKKKQNKKTTTTTTNKQTYKNASAACTWYVTFLSASVSSYLQRLPTFSCLPPSLPWMLALCVSLRR
jgi:hypothetical protein